MACLCHRNADLNPYRCYSNPYLSPVPDPSLTAILSPALDPYLNATSIPTSTNRISLPVHISPPHRFSDTCKPHPRQDIQRHPRIQPHAFTNPQLPMPASSRTDSRLTRAPPPKRGHESPESAQRREAIITVTTHPGAATAEIAP